MLVPRGRHDRTARRINYSKYWEGMETESGRFGSSVYDNTLRNSYPRWSSPLPTISGIDPLAAVPAVAGTRAKGVGKGAIHWGKQQHHHGVGNDEGMSEPLIGDATAKLRYLYFQRQLMMRRRLAAENAARGGQGIGMGRVASGDLRMRSNFGGRGRVITRQKKAAGGNPPTQMMLRGESGVWTAGLTKGSTGRLAGAVVGVGSPRWLKRSSHSGHGWESHTVKAQLKTEEYMLGREDLAPDMRQNVVLDKQVGWLTRMDICVRKETCEHSSTGSYPAWIRCLLKVICRRRIMEAGFYVSRAYHVTLGTPTRRSAQCVTNALWCRFSAERSRLFPENIFPLTSLYITA